MNDKTVSIEDCWIIDNSSIPKRNTLKLILNKITNALVYDFNVRLNELM